MSETTNFLTTVLGGKAASLVRLRAVGLPTPRGFVVTHALSAALAGADPSPLDTDANGNDASASDRFLTAPFPPGFEAGLAARLAALGGDRFSVRSSFAHEDRAGEVAAGLYDSVIDVPAAAVAQAVRRVLASAVGAGARVYAATHGFSSTAPPLAVLVHAYLPAIAHGGAAAQSPDGDPTAIIVDVTSGALDASNRAAIQTALKRLCALHGPSETEWVVCAAGPAATPTKPTENHVV
ncbi:MAG TPA: PEP/pyruvate-binding domain-containing protein, partial [Polyangia bacterium]